MQHQEVIIQILKNAILNSQENKNGIVSKLTFAHNYREIGFWETASNAPLPQIEIDFFDGNKIQAIYADLLNGPDRFNKVEVYFDKELNAEVKYMWDQAYYDADVAGNQKLKKKK